MKHPAVIAEMVLLGCVFLYGCRRATTLPATQASSPLITAARTYENFPIRTISGTLLNAAGNPVPGATVRVQATTNQTITDEQGQFLLGGLQENTSVTISAWGQGYYCAKVDGITPPTENITILMRSIQTKDNPDYQWISPTGENSCFSCKPEVTQVWLDNDAHGKSATNIRFLTMYNGTDVNGNQSPPTRFGYSRDYGRVPLRPDLTQPYYGPGYKLDFPDTTGNCSACHTPGAAVDAPYGTDPTRVGGVNEFGVHCDYCHKVADVILDRKTGLPFANMPGVLSQDIRRPFTEDLERYQIFFGSFDDDNVPMEDTFLPLIEQSQWCAPCHYGVFWDTLVYNSFGEWLASPYSNPSTGKTCQQCHMPAPTMVNNQPLSNVAQGKGGVERDPLTIPAHTFPGASSIELLQNAVTMHVSAIRTEDTTSVTVTITNDQTGHSVPTDSPLRQMLLLVQARRPDGSLLSQVSGPTIPEWGGAGDPEQGYLEGLPGKGYAKILMELWTEISPSGAYWNPTRIISDNRISAMESDSSTYEFSSPSSGVVRIEVKIIFRRAFIDLVDQKGWEIPDILMEAETIELTPP